MGGVLMQQARATSSYRHSMRMHRVGTIGVLVGLFVALPQGAAQAATVHPSRLLTSADVPAALGSPVPGASVVVTLPSRGGIELCDTLLGRWQVQIAGPSTFTQVIIPTNAAATSTVSELVYVFPSTAEAERAYAHLVSSAKKCNHVASGTQQGVGRVTTTVTTGSFPGITAHPQVWVNHRDVYSEAKPGRKSEDVGLSVFTQSRNAILVTMDTTMTKGLLSDAERQALGQLAQDLSERWYATAPKTITPAANGTTVNMVVGQQARFSGLPMRDGEDLNVTADPKGVVTIARNAAGVPIITAKTPGTTTVTVAYDEGGMPVLTLTIAVA